MEFGDALRKYGYEIGLLTDVEAKIAEYFYTLGTLHATVKRAESLGIEVPRG